MAVSPKERFRTSSNRFFGGQRGMTTPTSNSSDTDNDPDDANRLGGGAGVGGAADAPLSREGAQRTAVRVARRKRDMSRHEARMAKAGKEAAEDAQLHDMCRIHKVQVRACVCGCSVLGTCALAGSRFPFADALSTAPFSPGTHTQGERLKYYGKVFDTEAALDARKNNATLLTHRALHGSRAAQAMWKKSTDSIVPSGINVLEARHEKRFLNWRTNSRHVTGGLSARGGSRK